MKHCIVVTDMGYISLQDESVVFTEDSQEATVFTYLENGEEQKEVILDIVEFVEVMKNLPPMDYSIISVTITQGDDITERFIPTPQLIDHS